MFFGIISPLWDEWAGVAEHDGIWAEVNRSRMSRLFLSHLARCRPFQQWPTFIPRPLRWWWWVIFLSNCGPFSEGACVLEFELPELHLGMWKEWQDISRLAWCSTQRGTCRWWCSPLFAAFVLLGGKGFRWCCQSNNIKAGNCIGAKKMERFVTILEEQYCVFTSQQQQICIESSDNTSWFSSSMQGLLLQLRSAGFFVANYKSVFKLYVVCERMSLHMPRWLHV